MLNLKIAGDMTQAERLEISSNLQSMLFNELLRAHAWKKEDIVLHGGTSFRMRWNSERFSEDLDFMISESMFDKPEAICAGVVERVRRQATMMWPECDVGCRNRTRVSEDGKDVMHTWDIRWYHPNRRGKVMVKAEFYRVSDSLLSRYKSHIYGSFNGGQSIKIRGVFPVPDLVALWGDKIKAIATRTEFKWRDAHDLGFLNEIMERFSAYNDNAMLDSLLTSCSIYDKDSEFIFIALKNRFEAGYFKDYESFSVDMSKWFSTDTVDNYKTCGYIDKLLDGACTEVERALKILSAHISAKVA